MSNIIKKQSYLSPFRFIHGRIVEYDIKSANISCLRDTDNITEEDYQYLAHLPKIQREVEIGLREKVDPKLYTVIKNTISEAKDWLQNTNNISDNSIVRVANDAVYINSPFDLQYTQYSPHIVFLQKSISDIYLKLNKTLWFISLANNNISIDIKGVSEDRLTSSYNYLISEIVSIVLLSIRSSVKDSINYLAQFIEQYLRFELPVEFYRELDTGKYRIKNFQVGRFQLLLDTVSESDKFNIDINCNYSLLRELWSILIEQYNIHQK